MALNPREKRLARITGVMAGVVGVYFAFTTLTGPLTTLRAQKTGIENEIASKGREIQRGNKAKKQLLKYRQSSLPSDPAMAQAVYKNWLLTLTNKADFKNTSVTLGTPVPKRGIYETIPFSISARGTLDGLTRFLYEFYSKDCLQRIVLLSAIPVPDSNDLNLIIAIQALALPESKHADALPDGPSERLADRKLADYEVISRRNLFATDAPVQVVAPPNNPPPPDTFDPSKYTFLSTIIYVNEQPEAWLLVRTTGKEFRLSVGDTFEVGSIKGKVVEIHDRDAEIELNGKRHLVSLGMSLDDSVELAN